MPRSEVAAPARTEKAAAAHAEVSHRQQPKADGPVVNTSAQDSKFEKFAAAVDFTADAVTVAIGLATIIGLITFRKKIALALRNIRINHLDDRASEVRATLDEIEVVSFSRATGPQLRMLFGKLNGQLIGLKALVPELEAVQVSVHDIIHNSGRLNDPIKQQLIYHIRGILKNTKLFGLEAMTRDIK